MSTHEKTLLHHQPVADEWGFYDPDQAGLAAVIEKLASRESVAPTHEATAMAGSMREAQQLAERK